MGSNVEDEGERKEEFREREDRVAIVGEGKGG